MLTDTHARRSFTYGDPRAIDAAAVACADLPAHAAYDRVRDRGKYPMCLNPHDLRTVLTALRYYADTGGTSDDTENAEGIYACIMETLGIELI